MHQRTTTALLDGLADENNQAIWDEFDGRLRPMLVGFGIRSGLAQTDAADAAQETLTRFVELYRAGRFDPTRGGLRSWIFGIARNCVRELQDQKIRRREQRGMSAVEAFASDDELEGIWEEQWKRTIIEHALHRLADETKTDPRTIRIVELLALHARTPQQAADDVGMTVDEVYVAKHRCLRRLRTLVEETREAFET